MSAAVLRVEIKAELSGGGPVVLDYLDQEFVPDHIVWSVFASASGPFATAVVHGGLTIGETNRTYYLAEGMPEWVPAPPMGWEAFVGMVASRVDGRSL